MRLRRGFDFDSAHQSSDGGCPLKTAINGGTQPAVLLRMRYWPPPMLAGAWFQKPCWVLGLAVEVELGGGVSTRQYRGGVGDRASPHPSGIAHLDPSG